MIGSYTLDSHFDERVVLPDGNVTIKGNIEAPVQPFEIPYRALIPGKSQVQNLLSTVCISTSHVASSTLRMEPHYMIARQQTQRLNGRYTCPTGEESRARFSVIFPRVTPRRKTRTIAEQIGR
jgi:hypothetical protein